MTVCNRPDPATRWLNDALARGPALRATRLLVCSAALLAIAGCSTPADDPDSIVAKIASGRLVEDKSQEQSQIDIERFLDRGFCPRVNIPNQWNFKNQRSRSAKRRAADDEEIGGSRFEADVLYQASITEVSRECRTLGDTINMRIGIAGRVARGPASGSIASVDLPITVEIVDQTTDPATIVSSKIEEVKATYSTTGPSTLWSVILENVQAPANNRGIAVRLGFDKRETKRRRR